ncbi:P-loop containing nucleoside triphosphate hydrolase protein [Xylariomycetidae sp. FL0641]|nr:P-loop containing nucleoside triphosphate hydrolase protein [Xylariomycetidae sp. FL0641]
MSDYVNPTMQNTGNSSILTKVDKLRELIGTRVDLPQLVVVGDQSSGKSSVLEGVTGFAFPRDVGLCTRYATQITCRRDPISSIIVTIIPGPNAAPHEQERVKAFRRTLTHLSVENLPQVFKDANDAMGIRNSTSTYASDGSNLPTFSEHILRIEKLGPDEEHFTVIDVPGIFRNPDPGLTTDEDIGLVRDMVQRYMQDTRTIILAIMPSNVDPATQEILKLAKGADPDMRRTMAVLTKPDLATEKATQRVAIDYVLGRRGQLTLGYYIVKNRGPDEADKTLEQGLALERALFSSDPWSALRATGRAGMENLKVHVRQLLIDLIKREFPKLKAEVNKELFRLQAELGAMGQSRSNPHTQRAYLNKMSEVFQARTRDALNAYYTADNFFSARDDIRLITRVVEENEKYSTEMENNGHTRAFSSDPETDTSAHGERYCLEASPSEHAASGDCDELEYDAILDEIFDTLDTSLPEPTGPADIMKYIEEVYKGSRGLEIGTFGSSLLGTIFKEQSRKWEPITMSHMKKIILHVHHFISEAIKDACPDARVREELWDGYLVEELLGSYRKAMDHTGFLLQIEREQSPMTLNHYFNDNLQKVQAGRLVSAMEKLGIHAEREGVGEGFFLTGPQLAGFSMDKANSEHVREQLHDVLKSYYKVARKRFVDVVCQQAVNYYLLAGKFSPLKVFSTEMVLNLNEEQLDMIAAEDASVKLRREKLVKDIEQFHAALKVLKGTA